MSTEPIDVHHLGRERVICCWRVGDVLIDPGPESSVEHLLRALPDDFVPRALLLTHIHFDHAGAAGALVRRWPAVPVYVHERGARHLAEPERLIASARRLYDDFAERWGEVVPIPHESLHILEGGESVEGFRVAHTPGHAPHHVSYLDEATGRAFVGDMAGVRIPPAAVTVPPTPPPDIDLELWADSLETIAAWAPSSLALTHFGEVDDPPAQLDEMRERLGFVGELARDNDEDAFVARLREWIASQADAETAAVHDQANPPHLLYLGLERYERQRAERAQGAAGA